MTLENGSPNKSSKSKAESLANELEDAQSSTPEDQLFQLLTTKHTAKAIHELENLIPPLLEKIRDRLEKGSYSTIIGDDASGRIPALIFSRIIRQIYQKRGFKRPETLFIAGSRELNPEKKKEKEDAIFKHLQKSLNGKDIRDALVITDTVETGNSLLPLGYALQKLGISFDVAAIGFYEREIDGLDPEESLEEEESSKNSYEEFLEKLRRGEIKLPTQQEIEGQQMQAENAKQERLNEIGRKAGARSTLYSHYETPRIFYMKETSGIVKENSAVLAQRNNEPGIRQQVILARELAKDVSERLYEDFEAHSKS